MGEKERMEQYRKEILVMVEKIQKVENLKRVYKLLEYLFLHEK